MLDGRVAQQHQHINVRQRIIIKVVKLAVVRRVRLVVELRVRLHKADAGGQRGGQRRDGLQITPHDGENVRRGREVEERGIFHQIRRRPHVLEITPVGTFARLPHTRALGNDFFRVLQHAVEMR